jgi:hypothetical protein
MHKLSAPWEGPFIQWGDGQGVPNPWNVEH